MTRHRAPSTPCPHGQPIKANCKVCVRARTNAWRAANPGRYRASYLAQNVIHAEKKRAYATKVRRSDKFTRQYGITYAEALAMRDAQGNLCAICGGEMSDVKYSATRWAVDHYDTPAGPIVRGILHSSCNRALGLMNDHDPQALRNAADYIERHGRAATRPTKSETDPKTSQLALKLVRGDE